MNFVYLKNGRVLSTNTPTDSQIEAKWPKQIVYKVCGRHSWTAGLSEPWPMVVSYKWLSSGVSIFRPNPVQYLHHLPCTLTKFIDDTKLGWTRKWLVLIYLKGKAAIHRDLDRSALKSSKDKQSKVQQSPALLTNSLRCLGTVLQVLMGQAEHASVCPFGSNGYLHICVAKA